MCGSWDGTGQFFLATTKFRAATAKFLPTIKSSFLLNRYAIAAINLGPAC